MPLVTRGRGVFSEYYNDPAKTAESFYEGGWFRTGDLGSMDAEGRMTFKGRLKDMLKVGGENVAAAAGPISIENATAESALRQPAAAAGGEVKF